jgi:hypothetical protein
VERRLVSGGLLLGSWALCSSATGLCSWWVGNELAKPLKPFGACITDWGPSSAEGWVRLALSVSRRTVWSYQKVRNWRPRRDGPDGNLPWRQGLPDLAARYPATCCCGCWYRYRHPRHCPGRLRCRWHLWMLTLLTQPGMDRPWRGRVKQEEEGPASRKR